MSGPARRILIAAIAIAYAFCGTLFHEDVQEFVRLLQRERQWMWLMTTLSAGAVAVLAWAISVSRRGRGGGVEGWSSGWTVLIVAASAGYFLLMSYPTEVVHYLQYGLLAILIAYATRRIDVSFILTTCAGMLDEAYQYWWLHRNWGVYYDFNDVLLNIIAAGLGLAVMVELQPGLFRERKLLAATPRTQRTQRKDLRSVSEQDPYLSYSANSALSATLRETSFQFALLFLSLFAVGVWTGLIALQAADVQDHTLLLLNRMKPFDTFWETWGGTAKAHHVVRAWPGVVITGLLTMGGVRLVENMRETKRRS